MSRAPLPKNYQKSPGVIHDQVDNIGLWSSGAASTEYVKNGTQSLKFNYTGLNSNADIVFSSPIDLSAATTVGVWVYIGNRFEIADNIRVVAWMGTNPLTSYYKTLATSSHCFGGWLFFGGDKAQFTAVGTPNWSAIASLRVWVFTGNASADDFIYIDSIVSNIQTRPKVLISFDDGSDTVYSTTRAIANTNNIKFTCYVNSGTIGDATKMTESNLVDLKADGHEIANHSSAHDSYDTIGLQQAFANFETGKAWLKPRGYAWEHTAYVGGAHDKDLVTLLENAGYKTGRNATNNIYHDPLPVPSADFFNMKPTVLGVGTTTLTQAKTAIDQAILTKSTCIFYGHIIKTGAAGGTEWETSDWTALCEYIALKKSQGLIDDMTISKWYDGLSGTRLSVTSRTAVSGRLAATGRQAV